MDARAVECSAQALQIIRVSRLEMVTPGLDTGHVELGGNGFGEFFELHARADLMPEGVRGDCQTRARLGGKIFFRLFGRQARSEKQTGKFPTAEWSHFLRLS